MIRFVLFILLFVGVAYCIKNKMVIRFDTLFRKGFKKYNDKYGVVCYVR